MAYMAEQQETATAGKNVTLKYSAERFDQYYKQLKALCLKSRGSWILTKLVTDPITEFLEQQLLKIGDDATTTDEESSTISLTTTPTAKEKLTERIAKLKAAVSALKVPTDQELKDHPEDVTYDFFMQVKNSKPPFKRPDVSTLNLALRKWLEAEQTIYAIAVATLREAPQFIIDVEGAGRKQLEHLLTTHKTTNRNTTKTLKRIFEQFTYKVGPPPEGLSRYHQRLHELVGEMGLAKPKPLVRNAEEILDTYREGLERVNLYSQELRSCEIGRYNLEQTHTYLLSNENIRGVHLCNTHGMAKGLADVSGAKLHGGRGRGSGPGGKQELCYHFCTTGRCRFGDKCKYLHPSTVSNKGAGSKGAGRGVCFNFAAGKHCRFGDKCRFKHEKKDESSAADSNNASKDSEGDDTGKETAQFEGSNFDCTEHFAADNNNVVLEVADKDDSENEHDNDADDDENIDTDEQYLLNHNGTPSSSASYSSSDWDFNTEFKEPTTKATADTPATTDNEDNPEHPEPMTELSADSADAMTESSGADSADLLTHAGAMSESSTESKACANSSNVRQPKKVKARNTYVHDSGSVSHYRRRHERQRRQWKSRRERKRRRRQPKSHKPFDPRVHKYRPMNPMKGRRLNFVDEVERAEQLEHGTGTTTDTSDTDNDSEDDDGDCNLNTSESIYLFVLLFTALRFFFSSTSTPESDLSSIFNPSLSVSDEIVVTSLFGYLLTLFNTSKIIPTMVYAKNLWKRGHRVWKQIKTERGSYTKCVRINVIAPQTPPPHYHAKCVTLATPNH